MITYWFAVTDRFAMTPGEGAPKIKFPWYHGLGEISFTDEIWNYIDIG